MAVMNLVVHILAYVFVLILSYPRWVKVRNVLPQFVTQLNV